MFIQPSAYVCLGKVLVKVTCNFMCFSIRLGQASNHIAALLFYIEHHANDPELPTKISKTS